MKRLSCYAALFAFMTVSMRAQTNAPTPPQIPATVIVNQLWTMATTGELLTEEGRKQAAYLYVRPGPTPKDKTFSVVSNFWGFAAPVPTRTRGNKAEVTVDFWPDGSIDSTLRYIPEPPSRYSSRFFALFRLKLTLEDPTEYGPDGKTVVHKSSGYYQWQIEGPLKPFATTNAAIRYVLEMRSITKDPVVRRNADKTLAILLRLDDLYRKPKDGSSACTCD